MNTIASVNWHDANQHYLMQAVNALSARILRQAGMAETTDQSGEMIAQDSALDPPPALERLCSTFGLSRFEREILLVCAGVELDSHFAQLITTVQTDPRRTQPTFGLALAVLAEPHWSALTPTAPLRRWRLIEVSSGDRLMNSPLRIDERVLHYLAGVSYLDERLAVMLEDVQPSAGLPKSQAAQAGSIARNWMTTSGELSVVVLHGESLLSKRAVAASACAQLGLSLYALAVQSLPQQAAELDAFARLWWREAALTGAVLLIENHEVDTGGAGHEAAITRLCNAIPTPLLLSTRARRLTTRRPQQILDICKPTAEEQQTLWQQALGPVAERLNGALQRVGAQFDLDCDTIRDTAEALQTDPADDLETRLWDLCRAQTHPQITDLVERIQPAASWDELVLSEMQKTTLREIAAHVRHRARVYQSWGFAAQGARGLGISALFYGQSGTGKTMAAEVLANELRLDLYRIDLSRVVSKYIGETEDRLRRVFDAAESGGAILLFDEADALFGKRSEVKDSHDRYANIEVSYLLQRMESYRGLAILTTNIKNSLDHAFLRRLRFIVQFPFPDAAQRAEIWRRVFPSQMPMGEVDFMRLAKLQMPGGNIRSMAMNAAFLAAESARPLDMSHLLQAVRGEYAKLERPLSDVELGGWL
jgi:hypothetical protein